MKHRISAGVIVEKDGQLLLVRHVKPGRLLGGTLSTAAREAVEEHIVEAAWLGQGDLKDKVVFPPMLVSDYWKAQAGGPSAEYVGLRAMAFY